MTHQKRYKLTTLIIILILTALACTVGGGGNDSVSQTQVALSVEQTAFAQQQAQSSGGNDSGSSSDDLAATQAALSAQQTAAAQPPTDAPPTQPPPPPASTAPDFDDWMKNDATILLYEDMAGNYNVTRAIQQALKGMGVNYYDVADRLGDFKSELLSGGSNGTWDLIISASENRGSVSGEFYDYLLDALNDGSSVVIETWYMDQVNFGTISGILSKCGVEFQADWFGDPIDYQLLYQVDNANPILSQPNTLKLTSMTDFWQGDLGDLMQVTSSGKADILFSPRASTSNTHAVSVACLDNQLVIQTFSTNNYERSRVLAVWENYVYNLLLSRYDRLFN